MSDNLWNQWHIEYDSGIPVYRQIINQACAAVANGTFNVGDQLPTVRALSERLNVNPNTVAKAYRELELKGLIISERGSGSFVQAQPPGSQARGKKAKLQNLYQNLLAEAARNGLSETELLEFLKDKNPSTL